jgi:hypothetical protein
MSCAVAAPAIAHTNIVADSVAFNQWLKIIIRSKADGGRAGSDVVLLTGRHGQRTTRQRRFSSLH